MDLATRLAVIVAALALAGVGWVLLQRRRGALRPEVGTVGLPGKLAAHAGERLTLVQVSSEHCAACVTGARIWRAALAEARGVAFVEVDAADHLDLVRALGVLTTPTTLVYDASRTLTGRVSGAPTPSTAAAVLAHETEVAR